MKLLLIGAASPTGRVLLTEALQRGHTVTALVRNPAKLASFAHPALRVVTGDMRQPAALAAAVPGHEAVLLVEGSPRLALTNPLANGTAKLIWEMQVANVPRLLVLSRQGAGTSRAQMSWWWQLTTRLLRHRVFADYDQQEAHIRESAPAWTILRATKLVDGPATAYVTAPTRQELPATALSRVSRAAVAACLLDQLAPGAPVCCALTLTGAAAREAVAVRRPAGQLTLG